MPTNQKWTGGIANREWNRGKQAEPTADPDAINTQVRQYLTDCHANRQLLDPRYHPTEDGALKIVFHQGHAQETAIRAAYRHLTQA